jgi:hypothetical protein
MFNPKLDDHVLVKAAKEASSIEGLSLELGVNDGRGSELILESFNQPKTHICLDPYGRIPYDKNDEELNGPCGHYTNDVRNRAIISLLAKYGHIHNIIFLILEDSEFFKMFDKGIPIYDAEKRTINKYSFVFIDGPHSRKKVRIEARFFSERMSASGLIVFENVDFYDHKPSHNIMMRSGFDVFLNAKTKIAYIKKNN